MFICAKIESFAEAEMRAMCLDGELMPVAARFAPIDLPWCSELKMGLHSQKAPPNAIVCELSAAWIFGAIPRAPRKLHVCAPQDSPSVRHSKHSVRHGKQSVRHGTSHVVQHELSVQPDDVIYYGRTAVTSPERTLLDLLRLNAGNALLSRLFIDNAGQQHSIDLALHRFIETYQIDTQVLRERLERSKRMPHKHNMLATLDRIEHYRNPNSRANQCKARPVSPH